MAASLESEVTAALERWGSTSPAADLVSMLSRWPGLKSANLEDDVRPRLTHLQYLMSVSAFSEADCLRMVVGQPRVLSNYRVQVLWQQNGLVALNKPRDMRIDIRSGEDRHWPEERTVACWFQATYPGQPVRFCNQLDHATSGVILMASDKKAARRGSQLFERRVAKKTYLALVLGHPPWDGEVCLNDRLTDGEGFARRVAGPHEPGELAETFVKVVKRGIWVARNFGTNVRCKASLLEIRPVTGRRHQIRLHVTAAGHPILGDDAYNGHPGDVRNGAYRMFLHAHRLELPLGQARSDAVVIEAPCDFVEELEPMMPGDDILPDAPDIPGFGPAGPDAATSKRGPHISKKKKVMPGEVTSFKKAQNPVKPALLNSPSNIHWRSWNWLTHSLAFGLLLFSMQWFKIGMNSRQNKPICD